MSCSDSNPPSAVVWRKEGLPGIFSADADINYSPVTRHTAGVFSCEAENALGRSKPAYVEIDVKCKWRPSAAKELFLFSKCFIVLSLW